MRYSEHRIRTLIGDIRRRWRRRALVQGASITIGILAAWSIGLVAAQWLVGFPPAIFLAGCVLGLVHVVYAAARYVARPALRKIDDQQIAMYIEERVPELEDRLISAVEVEDPAASRRAHSALVDRLIDDAADRAKSLPIASVVDRRREKILAGAAAAGLATVLLLGYFSIDGLRVSLWDAQLGALMAAPPPYMTVDPGNVEIEQGGSQDVVATLRDATDRDVVLHYRQGDGEWIKQTMQSAVGEPAYLHEFMDVQEPISYFVEHDQQRSDVFEVSLYTFPAVGRIDLTYIYPEYTGRSPQREEDGGDIYGLRGSSVVVEVMTNSVTETAALLLDDGSRIELEPFEPGQFRGTLRLEREGSYTVRLTDRDEKENKFPEEYRISPVDDERPYITITDPQRDVRANAIEEVLIAARVQDDFGVEDVRLRFAVNAGEEQTLSLISDGENASTDVEGEHLLFLEDYALSPGDVISYFIEAEDGFHADPEVTDMYFIEVIPFDREYTQAGSGGGMSGGGASATVLSQQQIIAATWKLHRQEAEISRAEYTSSRRALMQAQENLRRNIDERIGQTAFSLELQQDESSRELVQHLRDAVDAMQNAVEELDADRLRAALTPEREALNHLLKADAMNRERQVAMNRGGQGGGGGAATEERMTELMDLELDISKDKYEVLPQSSQANAGGPVDEAMEKLRELARRQQNLTNESRHTLEGEDKKRQVERLQRDQNELRREAQSLARRLEQNARSQGQSSEGIEQAMERVERNMREAEQALRDGDAQQAQARQQQALNELERLTQDMQRTANDSGRESLERMVEAFDELREQEERLAQDLEREAAAARQRGRLDREALDDLAQRRAAARDALDRLESEARDLSERQTSDREVGPAARNVRQAIERDALDDQMEDSEESIRRGWLDNARRRQESIAQGLERLEEAVREVEDRLPVTDEERLARSLDALQELERELRDLQQQSQAGPEEPSAERSQSSASAGGDRSQRAEAASRQARLERARRQLERLQQELGRTPALNALQGAIARADHEGVSLEGESAEAFFNEEVFAPLSQLEEALMQELDRLAVQRKLYGSRPGDVPAEYRELVEKYYERLSKSDGL